MKEETNVWTEKRKKECSDRVKKCLEPKKQKAEMIVKLFYEVHSWPR